MTKRTRLYTRAGDDGTTGLVGGSRIDKDSKRLEGYGTVDELSSAIGVARAALDARSTERSRRLDAWLSWTQDALFNLGAELATPAGKQWDGMALAGAAEIDALERAIDEADGQLEPLQTFIHPGGSAAGAALHVARTVCRRAERRVLALRRDEPDVSGDAVRYLNRLSDALFAWARWINDDAGVPEHRWSSQTQPPPPLSE
ncbi:MAG TPA: cob(I)yrinic acid a,c-diamide adenosyltransferase [Candidatus Tumulicola sp.]|jgi:cob(I)alamin adenosyltransferase